MVDRILYTRVDLQPLAGAISLLNPDLDKAALARQFAIDGRLRITDVLENSIAERIRNCCVSDVPYAYHYHVDGTNVAMPAAQMAAMSPAEQQDLSKRVLNEAAKGIGFLYCGYAIGRQDKATSNPNLLFLHEVFDYLNGREMLSFIEEIANHSNLQSADAQYTRFVSGQYLTRHRDDVTNQQRQLAFVFGFSKNWHPDWGGMLQFFEDDGTARDAWMPAFNTMSLFDIRHIHSVTYVTPFAREQRLSLTGWFRSAPPDA